MLVTTLVLAALTIVVVSMPFLRFAYRSPAAHVAIGTADGLIAALVAYLVFGRFRRSGSRSNLLLAAALLLLALGNLFLALPTVRATEGTAFPVWTSQLVRLFAAGMMAVAAFTTAGGAVPRRPAILLFTVAGSLLLVVIVAGLLLEGIDPGVDTGLSPETARRPLFVGHPGLHAIQSATMALFAVAAVGFTRLAERYPDPLTLALALATPLTVFASLFYALFSSVLSDYVYVGDLLRLTFYLVLLVGALHEIRSYWEATARAAVLEERRRIARNLHDGLAQELAFVATQARRFLRRGGGSREEVAGMGSAALRALDESRRAIAALKGGADEPLDVALAATAEEVTAREGVRLTLDLESNVRVPPETREELIRIAREALSNAARHGRARSVRLALTAEDGLRMHISDDGTGFDPETVPRGGFGLISMRERAEAIGGTVRVRSARGRGTVVEVALP